MCLNLKLAPDTPYREPFLMCWGGTLLALALVEFECRRKTDASDQWFVNHTSMQISLRARANKLQVESTLSVVTAVIFLDQ